MNFVSHENVTCPAIEPETWDAKVEGAELYRMVAKLYPICRSITGNGVRESLEQLRQQIPISLHEVATGTRVFDWEVPKEWNIHDGYIRNSLGEKVVDFHKSNLHVVNYSVPVNKKMHLSELRSHLFTLPHAPDWIPYRTSYYEPTWGFCLSHRQLENLAETDYEVYIDSTLTSGHLTYGEFRIQGETDSEVLISAHSCHPSLCNDNLSGIAISARLARHLSGRSLRYSYRFVWIPGTIGSITWLALNEALLPRIKHGLVLSCVGDPGQFTYKRSRQGNTEIDRVVEHVLQNSGHKFRLLDFSPHGYDERQYCSPGINLPVGCFMRTPNGDYPEYHTSADDLNLVQPSSLAASLQQLLQVITTLEANETCINLNPKCEPQLGRRGLYRQVGGTKNVRLEEAMLWVLNLSDGTHSLLDIATRSGFAFTEISAAVTQLKNAGLLTRAEETSYARIA